MNIKGVREQRYKADCLSGDQYCQLIRFARATQPYLPFKEIAFIELIKICALFSSRFWWNEGGPVDSLKKDLQKFKQIYYPYGFKINKNILSSEQYGMMYRLRNPRFKVLCLPEAYDPIEKIAFVKTQRACYKWLTSLDNEQNTDAFIDRIKMIATLVRR